IVVTMYFYFSSRRRHTRFDCDWSSDVCSSDLCHYKASRQSGANINRANRVTLAVDGDDDVLVLRAVEGQGPGLVEMGASLRAGRSEERRVEKECRSRWAPYR